LPFLVTLISGRVISAQSAVFRKEKVLDTHRKVSSRHFIFTRVGIFSDDSQKALTHESGMMGPGVLEDEVQGGEEGSKNASEEGPTKRGGWKKRGSQRRLSCKHCGSATHTHINSKDCPKNPNPNGGEVLAGEPDASEMKSWERGHTLPV
jgi:hypothetical protein